MRAVLTPICEVFRSLTNYLHLAGCGQDLADLDDTDKKQMGWVKRHQDRRKTLNLEPMERPWTGREGIHLRGVRRQEAYPNFAHEVLDLHFAQMQKFYGNKIDDPPPSDIFTDIRQGWRYQKPNGRNTLLCKTLVYNFDRDRILAPEEHLLLQGWDLDVDLNGINELFLAAIREYLNGVDDGEEPSRKVRRPQKKHPETCIKRMWGSSFALSDVGLFLYVSLLASPNNVFEHPPTDHRLDISTIPPEVGMTIVDLDNINEMASRVAEMDNYSVAGLETTELD